MRFLLLLLGVGLLVAAPACSTGPDMPVETQLTGTPCAGSWPALPSPLSGEASREPRAFKYINVPPCYPFASCTTAVPDIPGQAIELNSGAGEFCWAVYEVADLDLSQLDSLLRLEFTSPAGGTVYTGVSDYGEGTWWITASSIGTLDTVEIPLSTTRSLTAASPGNLYFLAGTWDGMAATLATAELHRGLVETAPPGLMASDGDYPDKVQLAWEPVDDAEGYVLEYKRSDADDTAWQELYGALGELNVSYQHYNNGIAANDPLNTVVYDYRVKTVYDSGDESGFSNVDSGYRLLAPPYNVSATGGNYADRIDLSWHIYPGIINYSVYYKLDSADEEAWELLYEFNTTVDDPLPWSHTGAAPAGKEADFRTVYNYRITSAILGEESAPSTPVSGYRDLGTPGGLVASYNIYSDRVTLKWNAVTGAELYLVDRSTDGLSWSFLDMSSQTSYPDYTAAGFGDYYYRVRAALADGSEGDNSSSAAGSRLGWAKSDIDYGITGLPHCDIVVLDGRLGVAYINQTDNKLYFAHALDDDPGLPADWELSTVRTGTDYESITLDVLDGWPGLAFRDDEEIRFAVADDYDAGGGGFSFRHTVVDTGADYVYQPHFRVMAGKPAVSFIRKETDTAGLYYAYSMSTSPTLDTDWLSYQVTPVAMGAYAQALAEGMTGPKVAFNDGDQTILKYAVSNVGLPGSAANWTVGEVDDGYEIRAIHLITIGAHVLTSHATQPGPFAWAIAFDMSDTGTPAGRDDWYTAGGIGDDGSDLGGYHDLAWIYTTPAVCYRDNDTDALMYAAAEDAFPAPGGWAVCTVDATSNCGQCCALVQYNNLPAIVYWDADGDRLRLVRGL